MQELTTLTIVSLVVYAITHALVETMYEMIVEVGRDVTEKDLKKVLTTKNSRGSIKVQAEQNPHQAETTSKTNTSKNEERLIMKNLQMVDASMTVKELQAVARENNFKGYSRLRKAELIKFINENIAELNRDNVLNQDIKVEEDGAVESLDGYIRNLNPVSTYNEFDELLLDLLSDFGYVWDNHVKDTDLTTYRNQRTNNTVTLNVEYFEEEGHLFTVRINGEHLVSNTEELVEYLEQESVEQESVVHEYAESEDVSENNRTCTENTTTPGTTHGTTPDTTHVWKKTVPRFIL